MLELNNKIIVFAELTYFNIGEDKMMSKKKKPNDAIASWSGFNYQGKVALLYVMQLINEKNGNKLDYSTFSIELEKNEDFIIFDEDKPVSYHQVKALLSKKNLSGYNSALKKLIEHRDIGGNADATCHLISAIQIVDWDTDSNNYRNTVTLYKHGGEIVDICAVPSIIRDELSAYKSELNNEIAYLELCNLIDEKVSEIHKMGKTASYKIPFIDIVKTIEDTVNKQNILLEAHEKERVYLHITTGIKSKFNEFCELNCKMAPEECDADCGVKSHYDSLLNSNIWTWAKILNPNKNDWSSLKYVENMSSDKYRDNIFSLFSYFKSNEVYSEIELSYINDTFFNSINKKIIPTFINFTQPARILNQCIENDITEIKNNNFAIGYLNGNIITAETSGKVFSTIKDRITHFEVTSETQKPKITNFETDITIVDRNKLIEKLEESKVD